MRTLDTVLYTIVAIIIAMLFGILSSPVSGQNLLPDGVSVDGKGTYIVQRRVLRCFTRSEIKAFKKIADENHIAYKLVGKKHGKRDCSIS